MVNILYIHACKSQRQSFGYLRSMKITKNPAMLKLNGEMFLFYVEKCIKIEGFSTYIRQKKIIKFKMCNI